jgi:hypothetical protein
MTSLTNHILLHPFALDPCPCSRVATSIPGKNNDPIQIRHARPGDAKAHHRRINMTSLTNHILLHRFARIRNT